MNLLLDVVFLNEEKHPLKYANVGTSQMGGAAIDACCAAKERHTL
jgi:hypothetical protein